MKTKVLSFVLVLASVLAACTSAATQTAAPPTSPPADPPDEPAVAFPTGRFAAVNNTDEAYQFREDGAFEYYYSSGMDPLFEGVYSVNGDQVTIENPKETDSKCKGGATYQWSYEKGKLIFFPAGEDACQPRKDSLSLTYAHDTTYIPEMKIIARDFDYVAPKSVRSGWVRVTLTNSGTEPHHIQFLRLNDGVTFQQFEEALKQAEGPALAMTKQVGGVGAVHPGGVAQAVLNLPAGEYVILCLIPSPSDGVAHHAKGMIKSIIVRDESGHGNEPSADLTVSLKDFMFDMPDSLPIGKLIIQVTNEGPEPHELNILRLEDGKSVSDVTAFLNGAGGPPPFAPVGGMNGLDVGVTGYAQLDLAPGTYVAICNIPSPKAEGHPHFALGMIKQFAVGEAVGSNFPVGTFIKAGTTNYGLVFNADGTFHVFEGDNIFVHAMYTVDGNILTETSNDGGCETNISFTYTFDGTSLTFNYVGNPDNDATCTGRHADFNNVTYTLSQ